MIAGNDKYDSQSIRFELVIYMAILLCLLLFKIFSNNIYALHHPWNQFDRGTSKASVLNAKPLHLPSSFCWLLGIQNKSLGAKAWLYRGWPIHFTFWILKYTVVWDYCVRAHIVKVGFVFLCPKRPPSNW